MGFVQKSRFAQKLTILHRKSDTRNARCLVRIKEVAESRPPPFLSVNIGYNLRRRQNI